MTLSKQGTVSLNHKIERSAYSATFISKRTKYILFQSKYYIEYDETDINC